MSEAPEIVTRGEQPYAAVRARVRMAELGEFAARFGEVFGWLGARGLGPAGAPFFKYNLIDMERELEVEVGVPVAAAVDGDDQVISGVLPAGRYATLTHVGHPGAAGLGGYAGPEMGHVASRRWRAVGLPIGDLPD